MNNIYNEDCIIGAKKYIPNSSVDLIICDPPFGIDESTFKKHYYRDDKVIEGYVSAPDNYAEFSLKWISECKRILKNNGSLYIVSGWSNLSHILNAINYLNLNVVNHIIWKFNFGVFTKKKYVTSHYHILYLTKSKSAKPTFNTYCRFGFSEKTDDNRSLAFSDMESVWRINKEYHPGKMKNGNKLPEALIKKIIQYSSNEGDLICDFFMGNFTTAFVAKKMGRNVCGFELNPSAYHYFMPKLNEIEFGCDLEKQKIVNEGLPVNQGKKLLQSEIEDIKNEFSVLTATMPKKQALIDLSKKYGRGRWSLERILKRN